MTRPDTTPSAPPARPRGAFSEPLVWLVAGIPAATVVAGLFTLWIAHSGSDVPVGSAYVKQGLSVAPDTRREDRARALGLSGTLTTRVADGTLRIDLVMDPAGTTPPVAPGQPASQAEPQADSGPSPSPSPAKAPAASPPSGVTQAPGSAQQAGTTASGSPAAAADERTPHRLRLVHPSDPGNDLNLHLRPAEDGRSWFVEQPVTWADGTRWHIAIEGNDWRLPVPGLQAVDALEALRFDSKPR